MRITQPTGEEEQEIVNIFQSNSAENGAVMMSTAVEHVFGGRGLFNHHPLVHDRGYVMIIDREEEFNPTGLVPHAVIYHPDMHHNGNHIRQDLDQDSDAPLETEENRSQQQLPEQ